MHTNSNNVIINIVVHILTRTAIIITLDSNPRYNGRQATFEVTYLIIIIIF